MPLQNKIAKRVQYHPHCVLRSSDGTQQCGVSQLMLLSKQHQTRHFALLCTQNTHKRRAHFRATPLYREQFSLLKASMRQYLLRHFTTKTLNWLVEVLCLVQDTITNRTTAKLTSTGDHPKSRMHKLTTVTFDQKFSPPQACNVECQYLGTSLAYVQKPFFGTRVEKLQIKGTAGRKVMCRFNTHPYGSQLSSHLQVGHLCTSSPLVNAHAWDEDTQLM